MKSEHQEQQEKSQFELGKLLCTPGALRAIKDAQQSPLDFFTRHVRGDWGEVSEEDADENDLSVREGYRILSAYRTCLQVNLWVITEADRSATTILLPGEY